MEDVEIGSHGDSDDEAVGERAHCLAGSSASPVQRRRVLEVTESGDGDELASRQQETQAVDVLLVTAAGQHLHHHDIGGVHGGVGLDQAPHVTMGLAPSGAQVVDPRLRVDEGHSSAAARSARSSSRSASHPVHRQRFVAGHGVTDEASQGEVDGGTLRREAVAAHRLAHECLVQLDIDASHETPVCTSMCRDSTGHWRQIPDVWSSSDRASTTFPDTGDGSYRLDRAPPPRRRARGAISSGRQWGFSSWEQRREHTIVCEADHGVKALEIRLRRARRLRGRPRSLALRQPPPGLDRVQPRAPRPSPPDWDFDHA